MNTFTIIIPAAVLSIAATINGDALAADGSDGARMCPATAIPTAADRAMADWRKKRALYLHDLRLSSLEQRETTPPGKSYDLGAALIKADLYLSYAEADGLIAGKTKTGRDELNRAASELQDAARLAPDTNAKHEIESYRKTAMALNRDFAGCMIEEKPNEREGYQDLRRNIARTIKQVG